MERLRVVVERSALLKHPDRVGRTEEVVVEGPSKRDPDGHHRPDRAEQAGPLRRPRPVGSIAERLVRDRAGDRGRPPPPDRRAGRGRRPGRPTGPASPSPPAEPVDGRPGRAHRVGQVPVGAGCRPGGPGLSDRRRGRGRGRQCRGAARGRRGGGDVELVSVDSMAVYRGMDIGTAKPPPAVRAEVRYHLLDLVDPDEEFTVTRFQAAAREALAGIASRGNRALLVGGTGLYLRSVIDDLEFPGRFPEAAEASSPSWTPRGPEGSEGRSAACRDLHARLAALDPVAAGRIEPGNERRLVRALEVTLGSGRPFSSFGPGLERYPRVRVDLVGLRLDPAETDRRIAERFARLMDDGTPGRGPRAGRPTRRPVPHGPPGAGLPGAAGPRGGRRAAGRRPWTRPCGGPGRSPGASGRGSGGTPGSSGSAPTRTRWPSWRAPGRGARRAPPGSDAVGPGR